MPNLIEQRHRPRARRVLRYATRLAFGGAAAAGAAFVGVGGGPAIITGIVVHAIVALAHGSPEARARELEADARSRVPDREGAVTLVGTVGTCVVPIASPFSGRRCVA